MTSLILCAHDGAVATLTLNRPEKRNALNAEMWRGLSAHLRALATDSAVRCVVLQGADGHFAAGADMAEFAAHRATPDAARSYGEMMLDTLRHIRELPQPTIARIEGNCLGGGLELAAMCDLRIAADTAKFGIPIQRVGITMPYPELGMLVDLVGRAAMLEMLLEGAIHDAEWALRRGLVTRLVAPGDLASATTASTERLLAGSPQSHRNHKKFTLRCLGKEPLTEADLQEGYNAVTSADYREGIAAFLAKRRPAFTGQ
ncbi:enoyl-CoA hydratase/isomerase family protein [Dongia mobilis]|uniref:enoyl-CoA hydratase/isomerase family protein n=1 Tax=Dongia sp. TaxID=1977262 RepID=UPI0026EDFB30